MMSVIKKITKKVSSTGKSANGAKASAKKTSVSKTSGAKSVSKAGTSRGKSSMKNLTNEAIQAMVMAKAYEFYESRGYSHGNDLGDWYAAERFVMSTLKK